MSSLGEQLRSLRAGARLTQAELAERAGISERAVSDIERGLRNRLYAVTAERLADALSLDAAGRAGFLDAARASASPALPAALWTAILRTPLLGREAELGTLEVAIANPATRLITVTGPGGMGKTRLVAEACSRIATDNPGRMLFVSLAELRDPTLVAPTLAAAAGVADDGEATLDNLAGRLRGRGVILWLDTFEPVLDAAEIVGRLSDAVPDLTVVVTSRAPLRLRGEHELPLAPLGATDAARLFEERALAARPDLVFDDGARDTVAAICARLGGLPLAVELASTRVRQMSLNALLTQLDEPLVVLSGGERDLPDRQRTMRATVAWSHGLLTEQERVLFRRLAGFAGGWSLAAAAVVSADPGVRVDETLAALGRLGEHGLITSDLDTAEPRWRLADPVRDYAREQLAAADEVADIGARHCAFFTELAERAEPHLRAAGQSMWREVLRRESGNTRAALGWAIETNSAELALRLAAALWMSWRMEGAFAEGRAWVDRALALDGAGSAPHRGRALWAGAWLAFHQGAFERSAELGAELERIADAGTDSLDRRNALTVLGKVAAIQGRVPEAVAMFEEAVAICEALPPGWHLATSVLNLGIASLQAGEAPRARELTNRALLEYEALGDVHFAARAVIQLGYIAVVAGELETAAARFADGLDRFLSVGEDWGLAEALDGLALLSAARGDAPRAAALNGATRAIYAGIASETSAENVAVARPFLDRARASLGASQWDEQVARGRALSPDDAIELARSQPGR